MHYGARCCAPALAALPRKLAVCPFPVLPPHAVFFAMAASSGKLMQAIQYDSYGGGAASLKHVEVPIPSPKKDEVLLKLEAASLNPVDWKIQKGMMRPILPRKFPFIPVSDVAGEVVDVGSEVKSFKVGDKIVAMLYHLVSSQLASEGYYIQFMFHGILWPHCIRQWVDALETAKGGGGLAEYAVAPASLTVKRPPEVSAADGAGLPVAGLTALQALQSIGVKFDGSGKPANILVTAGSGGVGLYAVQLAKLGNLHVTATCGARNIELLRSLGADEVLDYKTPEGMKLESPSGKKYDAVIHGAMGTPWSTFDPNLSGKGKVLDLNPSAKGFLTVAFKKLTFSKKQYVQLMVSPKGENLDFLVGLVKEGKLKTIIDSRHPLSNAEEAWAKSMDGHATGKVIVEMEA